MITSEVMHEYDGWIESFYVPSAAIGFTHSVGGPWKANLTLPGIGIVMSARGTTREIAISRLREKVPSTLNELKREFAGYVDRSVKRIELYEQFL